MIRHQHQRTPAQPPRLFVLHLHLVPVRIPSRHEAPACVVLVVLRDIDTLAFLRRDIAGRSRDDRYGLNGIVERFAIVRVEECEPKFTNNSVEEDKSVVRSRRAIERMCRSLEERKNLYGGTRDVTIETAWKKLVSEPVARGYRSRLMVQRAHGPRVANMSG